jgi:hypothetical protein
MQTVPVYEYSALPTEDHDGQLEKTQFSSKNIIYSTITETVNKISCNKIKTDTNKVDTPLLEECDNKSQQNPNKTQAETYSDRFYNLISKCICIKIFN